MLFRSNDLGLAQVVEAVKLIEQLHQRALNFTVSTSTLGEASTTNGVYLIHEDNAWLVFLRISKHLPHYTRRLSNILVYDSRRDYLQEIGL